MEVTFSGIVIEINLGQFLKRAEGIFVIPVKYLNSLKEVMSELLKLGTFAAAASHMLISPSLLKSQLCISFCFTVASAKVINVLSTPSNSPPDDGTIVPNDTQGCFK